MGSLAIVITIFPYSSDRKASVVLATTGSGEKEATASVAGYDN
nr:456_t:CDS:2 [Entrophospora candida]